MCIFTLCQASLCGAHTKYLITIIIKPNLMIFFYFFFYMQEQITRVLLERLIVNRPHPWGLLITFIELIKNPIYKFWDHDFVHCAPEIEK